MDLVEHLEALREHVEGARAVAAEPGSASGALDGRTFESGSFERHIDALLASSAQRRSDGAAGAARDRTGTTSDRDGVEEASGRRGRES